MPQGEKCAVANARGYQVLVDACARLLSASGCPQWGAAITAGLPSGHRRPIGLRGSTLEPPHFMSWLPPWALRLLLRWRPLWLLILLAQPPGWALYPVQVTDNPTGPWSSHSSSNLPPDSPHELLPRAEPGGVHYRTISTPARMLAPPRLFDIPSPPLEGQNSKEGKFIFSPANPKNDLAGLQGDAKAVRTPRQSTKRPHRPQQMQDDYLDSGMDIFYPEGSEPMGVVGHSEPQPQITPEMESFSLQPQHSEPFEEIGPLPLGGLSAGISANTQRTPAAIPGSSEESKPLDQSPDELSNIPEEFDTASDMPDSLVQPTLVSEGKDFSSMPQELVTHSEPSQDFVPQPVQNRHKNVQSPDQNEAHRSNLSLATTKTASLQITMTTVAINESETSTQPESLNLTQIAESLENEPSLGQQEANVQPLENPKKEESAIPQGAVAQAPEIPEASESSVQQESLAQPSEPPGEDVAQSFLHPEENVPSSNQNEVPPFTVASITAKSTEITMTMFSEASNDVDSSLMQQEVPGQPLDSSGEPVAQPFIQSEENVPSHNKPPGLNLPGVAATPVNATVPIVPDVSNVESPVQQEAQAQPPEPSEESVAQSLHPEENVSSPSQNEAPHFNVPIATAKPVEVTVTVTTEMSNEIQTSSVQQEAQVQPPEKPEEAPTQPIEPNAEVADQSLSHPENGPPPSKNEAQPLNLPSVTGKPVDVTITLSAEIGNETELSSMQQEAQAQPPDSSAESLAQPFPHPQENVPSPSQNEGPHVNIPTVTAKPEDGTVYISPEITIEVEPVPIQEIAPAQPPQLSSSTSQETPAQSQNEAQYSNLPHVTSKPTTVVVTTTPEANDEVESSVQETQAPAPDLSLLPESSVQQPAPNEAPEIPGVAESSSILTEAQNKTPGLPGFPGVTTFTSDLNEPHKETTEHSELEESSSVLQEAQDQSSENSEELLPMPMDQSTQFTDDHDNYILTTQEGPVSPHLLTQFPTFWDSDLKHKKSKSHPLIPHITRKHQAPHHKSVKFEHTKTFSSFVTQQEAILKLPAHPKAENSTQQSTPAKLTQTTEPTVVTEYTAQKERPTQTPKKQETTVSPGPHHAQHPHPSVTVKPVNVAVTVTVHPGAKAGHSPMPDQTTTRSVSLSKVKPLPQNEAPAKHPQIPKVRLLSQHKSLAQYPHEIRPLSQQGTSDQSLGFTTKVKHLHRRETIAQPIVSPRKIGLLALQEDVPGPYSTPSAMVIPSAIQQRVPTDPKEFQSPQNHQEGLLKHPKPTRGSQNEQADPPSDPPEYQEVTDSSLELSDAQVSVSSKIKIGMKGTPKIKPPKNKEDSVQQAVISEKVESSLDQQETIPQTPDPPEVESSSVQQEAPTGPSAPSKFKKSVAEQVLNPPLKIIAKIRFAAHTEAADQYSTSEENHNPNESSFSNEENTTQSTEHPEKTEASPAPQESQSQSPASQEVPTTSGTPNETTSSPTQETSAQSSESSETTELCVTSQTVPTSLPDCSENTEITSGQQNATTKTSKSSTAQSEGTTVPSEQNQTQLSDLCSTSPVTSGLEPVQETLSEASELTTDIVMQVSECTESTVPAPTQHPSSAQATTTIAQSTEGDQSLTPKKTTTSTEHSEVQINLSTSSKSSTLLSEERTLKTVLSPTTQEITTQASDQDQSSVNYPRSVTEEVVETTAPNTTDFADMALSLQPLSPYTNLSEVIFPVIDEGVNATEGTNAETLESLVTTPTMSETSAEPSKPLKEDEVTVLTTSTLTSPPEVTSEEQVEQGQTDLEVTAPTTSETSTQSSKAPKEEEVTVLTSSTLTSPSEATPEEQVEQQQSDWGNHTSVPLEVTPQPESSRTVHSSPVHSSVMHPVRNNSEKSHTVSHEQQQQNVSTHIKLCERCTCTEETLSCTGFSPKRRLHRVPVPESNNRNTFIIL